MVLGALVNLVMCLYIYINPTYYVIYRTNVGRATPPTWLGPTRADWSNLVQRAGLFKGCLIASESGGR